MVAALTSGTRTGRELATLYHRDLPLSDTELVYAADLIERAGGRAWCRRKADDLLADALHHLRSANPATRPADELTTLARMITHRDH